MTTGPDARVLSGPAVHVVAESEWDAHILRLGAAGTYSCAAYHRISTLLEPDGTRPVLLAFSDQAGDVALPLLLRPLPDGQGWDATSAYGYGGPIGRGAPDLEAFGAALDEWAREHGVVSTFLRLNPMLGNSALVPPTAEVVDVGSTVAWGLGARAGPAAGYAARPAEISAGGGACRRHRDGDATPLGPRPCPGVVQRHDAAPAS